MHPIHDVDILLLMALALSSKRRPAELVEIIAAADLIQGVIPSELRLVDSFSRLAEHGLIGATESGFTLTPAAQKIMAGKSAKAHLERRIASIKEKLADYTPEGEYPPILLTAKQVCSAILAHRDSAKKPGKNLLVPKPKAADEGNARPGQRQRKPLPARRRKD